jgi:hypothetical protein
MPKIGDGYFQFSSRGLKDLLESIKLVGGNAKQLESIGRSRGLFENSLSKDLAAVRLLTAEIKNATKQAKSSRDAVRQLRAESARSSLNTDRLVEQRRATANSRANIARNDIRNVAASPSAMAAERTALRQRLMFADTERKRIEARALKDKSTTPSFKRRVSDAASSFAMTQAEAEDPAKLRAKAQEIRETAKALSGFKKGNVSQVVTEMNALADATEKAAAATDRLTKLENISSVMSPERKGQVRGSIRDELNAPARAAATSRRQSQREIDSESGEQRIGRRIDEIGARDDLTDSQRAAEISIASDEVVESLERLAQRVREVPIDTELQNVAEKFRQGTASEGEFRAAVTASKAKKSGVEQAANITGEAEFRARNSGDSESTVELTAKLKELAKTRDDLIKKNSTLSASEQEVNEAVIASISSDIKSTQSKRDISRALDAEIDNTKALLAEKSRLDVVEAKSGKLTGDDAKARKKNNEELDAAAKRQNKLKAALNDSNASLHGAARASRNLNFKYQQLSYGVQDFVQVIGQTGLSGALRASANNMAAFFGASGTGAGAIWGAVGTVAMIGLADAISNVGGEAETAEEKLEKLLRTTERFSKVKISGREFSSGVAEQALGKGDFAVGAGAKAREEATKSIDEIAKLIRTIDAVAQGVAKDTEAGRAREGIFLSDEKRLAAAKLQGASKGELDEIVKEALIAMRTAIGVGSRGEADIEPVISKYRESLNEITKLNLADAEHLAKLAAILDPANKKIEESLQEYKDKVSDLSVTAGHSSTSLDRMNESLDAFERDVLERSRFSDSALPKASDEIAARLSESASRLRGLTSDFEAVGSFDTPDEELTPEAKFRKELVVQEQAVFDRYLKSLESINSQIDSATSPSSGIAKTLGDLIAEFASARADLALAISSKPLAEQQAILKSSDAAKSRDLVSAVKDAVEGFSGEVAKTLGESQSQADQRMRRDLSDLLHAVVASETEADDVLIPSIRAAIDKIGAGKGQDGTAVTAIGDLHRKIQESLYDDTSDLDIQKEHSDLLKQIRDILGDKGSEKKPNSDVERHLEAEKAKRNAEADRSPFDGGASGTGNMSVPPPAFNYDSPSAGAAARRPQTWREAAESDVSQMEAMARQSPMTSGSGDLDMYEMNRILDDAGKASAANVFRTGDRELSGHDNRSKKYREIAERNAAARAGRMRPEGISDDQIAANVTRKIRDEGYTEHLYGSQNMWPFAAEFKSSADSFYGARRAGAVSDFQRTGPKFADDFPGGRRNPVLTESQRRSISSPAASSPVNETPEEQRKRRVAERRAEFGAMPDAGPQLNARTVKTAIAAMKPVFEAGPAFTREDADKFRKEKEAAGIAGREAAAQAAIDRREAAGPLFENTHEAQVGPRRAMEAEQRRAKGEAARAEKEEKIRAAAAARAADAERRAGIKTAAEEDLQSRVQIDPETGESLPTKKSNKWSRQSRERRGMGSSWMQKFEAGQTGPVAPLSSNVQTDATQQTQTAQTEAIQYQKRAADTLVEMLKLMKTRGPSEGLLIG